MSTPNQGSTTGATPAGNGSAASEPTDAGWYGLNAPGGGNPFAGVPARDFITDGVAFLLLCLSFSQGWRFGEATTDRIDVVVVTVISILSLAAFYLVRAGVFPAMSDRRSIVLRALLNLPYVLVVAVYLVLDATATLTAPSDVRGGLGPAIGIGLAGVALAVAPRAVELADAATAALLGRAVRIALISLGALAAVLQLVGLVFLVRRLGDLWDFPSSWWSVLNWLLGLVLLGAVAIVPVVATVRRSQPWRWVLVAVGATAVLYLVAHDAIVGRASGLVHTSLSTMLGNGAVVLLPAAGALAVGAATAGILTPVRPRVAQWFRTASAAWVSIAVVAGAGALSVLLSLVANAVAPVDQGGSGVDMGLIVQFVLLAFVAVGALVAQAQVRIAPVAGRPFALVVTVVVAVLGLVSAGISRWGLPNGYLERMSVSLPELLISIGLPLLVLVVLLVPREIRQLDVLARRAASGPRPQPAAAPAAPAPAVPVAAVPVASAPASFVGTTATDPGALTDESLAVDEDAVGGAAPASDEHPSLDESAASTAPDETGTPDETATPDESSTPDEAATPDESSTPDDSSTRDESGTPDDAATSDEHATSVETVEAVEHPVASNAPVTEPTPATPSHGWTAEQAADPRTELADLATIAAQAPELRVHLAENPSTYPDLVEWLRQLDDPEIAAALARRHD
ncbi:DUF7937 domain-containing protein [Cellulomonas composti]|uniref:Uncharacterized protein n=1 Tax=Cellulomonas composti TaxID=266130 RepID=A0A511J9X5_9CELL|nr:hypothetical protein [Cellulomonas composti]GEL94791.1 hypothetical protein CCO02nite_14490 [Cellulomonas composti]